MKFAKFISFLVGLCCAVAQELRQPPAENHEGHGRSLHLLVNPADADIDIVAVHGLDGHWKNSWTAENGLFWLQDLLPLVLPNPRIFSFGHDSRTRGADKPLTQDIPDHAKDLVWLLSNERLLTNTETRPLIFIGHSLGGLVVKSALLTSDQAGVGHLERHKYIKISTGGVFYLATPHQGGQGVSLAQIVTRAYSVFSYTNPKLLAKIAPNSEWLQSLQSSYNSISHQFDTTFFYETWPMTVPLLGRLLVVPKFSAVVPGARNAEEANLAADHKTISKYFGADDPNFKAVSGRLQVLARDVKQRVHQSWDHWRKQKQLDIQRHLVELQGRSPLDDATRQSTQSLESQVDFRVGLVMNQMRNRQFVGRKRVLARMDESLQGNDSQNLEIRVMVLFGTGGVGKTQIAFHYAHQSTSRYDSVFWIDGASLATATESIRQCLESIKSHHESFAGSKSDSRLLEMIRKAIQPDGIKDFFRKQTDTVENFHCLSRAFAAWLAFPGNTRWLIVIDNVDDPEVFDFRVILPAAQAGAVLVTSRRQDLSLMWDGIEVPSMEEEEAIELLEASSKLSFQLGTEGWIAAQRLVQTLGYLPLAIVQAGSFIAVQRPRNPFSSYLELLTEHPAELLN
ncbi:P-loop containing nucleoside triphosphate hydrolase protein [Rhypophila decipiens]|uniref:P-loop containing nucleoside triphosphate hydrolase protein n=1 Tax=Rhypophila decipiens TaxID=261697 RepID=A0AAN7B1Y6_9PEZI|nr:P-loop containing nucleoside triphosphate hydrolase protein [Rhypophila decipiens]